MHKALFFIFLSILFDSNVLAKSSIPSSIPLPKNQFIDIDHEDCGLECTKEKLNSGKVFTFMAKYQNFSGDDIMQENYEDFQVLFGMKKKKLEGINIAILVPQKTIGRYAVSTSNSIISYLIAKKRNFKFELFDCKDESEKNIITAIQNIKSKGYNYLIAPVTDVGAEIISKHEKSLLIYIPTVNRNFIGAKNPNIIFGGIDYNKQIQVLESFANLRIAVFSDQSRLSRTITNMVFENYENIKYTAKINSSKTNFKPIMKNNSKLVNSSIFLNTPLVKSSLIASQLRYYKIKPFSLLSTQINYHPLILTLTQYADRKNLYIANSIGKPDFKVSETNRVLENNINYDWINYSTSIGIDHIYSSFINTEDRRRFQEPIESNQVEYDIKIMKPEVSSFSEIEFFEKPL